MAAVFALPSVNSLRSAWDFFPPYGGHKPESSHYCQRLPGMCQYIKQRPLGAAWLMKRTAKRLAQRRHAQALTPLPWL
jgi:hypothetical protein